MKMLVTGAEIKNELIRLIQQASRFDWSVAWASAASVPFQHLLNNRKKIRRLVVGIHFYQTHPDFLKEFVGDGRKE